MDRFIVLIHTHANEVRRDLKSNMDRFIVCGLGHIKKTIKRFKIQYG